MNTGEDIMATYWPSEVSRPERMRHAFMISLVKARLAPGATIVDVGGGWGSFAAMASAQGYNAVLIDDFRDTGFFDRSDRRFAMQRDYNVTVVSRDVLADGLEFADASIDCFTCFDSMEHWHGSPKTALHQMRDALKPGGYLVIGLPNAVNLRKRVSMVLGRLDWTSMDEWYEQKIFRSHIREPRKQDLEYIARDLGMDIDLLTGRNWLLYGARALAPVAPLIDRVLRLRTTLCIDLYMVLRKRT